MPACEMCGSDAQLFKTSIEGAQLDVCKSCARFGKVIARPGEIRVKDIQPMHKPQSRPRRPEVTEFIVSDYSTKIRNAREKLGLTQEEFAKKLNERESIMQKIESGQHKPSIDMAKKLGRELMINLIDQLEEGEIPLETPHHKGDGFTLGDFIKTRKKKQ